jgi:uncharacterized protein YeaO (DUF488 family)
MSGQVWLRRAYDPPSPVDGTRVLVDRLWPRGVSKAQLRIDTWARDLAPSDELRHWFGHDPERWDEFRDRYRRELETQPDGSRATAELASLVALVVAGRRVTLVYGAHDSEHNNAVALRELLRGRAGAISSASSLAASVE